ncbi:hypothetical protein JMJ55_10440 [Belnapia sp. T6]|uniref:Uncharacterized protein n=1 Tax=Belnapia mucosa TaxID=2804532 RepID=A0ABS1V213_9PROT|nr:hypothetical protein [Belnapia mucosa]MBL6455744.1 hypothetical protein [Belnapia mucosa]
MSESSLCRAHFHVLAEASPGLLSRLLQPLAKRDLVPDFVRAVREGDLMRVELLLEAMPQEMVHLVGGNLGQVIGVLEQHCESGQALLLAA